MNEVERIRKEYPVGTKVKMVHMNDPHPIPSGSMGEVVVVDDIGQVHTKWENGRFLAFIPECDEVDIIH